MPRSSIHDASSVVDIPSQITGHNIFSYKSVIDIIKKESPDVDTSAGATALDSNVAQVVNNAEFSSPGRMHNASKAAAPVGLESEHAPVLSTTQETLMTDDVESLQSFLELVSSSNDLHNHQQGLSSPSRLSDNMSDDESVSHRAHFANRSSRDVNMSSADSIEPHARDHQAQSVERSPNAQTDGAPQFPSETANLMNNPAEIVAHASLPMPAPVSELEAPKSSTGTVANLGSQKPQTPTQNQQFTGSSITTRDHPIPAVGSINLRDDTSGSSSTSRLSQSASSHPQSGDIVAASQSANDSRANRRKRAKALQKLDPRDSLCYPTSSVGLAKLVTEPLRADEKHVDDARADDDGGTHNLYQVVFFSVTFENI